jgi:DNA ligase-1
MQQGEKDYSLIAVKFTAAVWNAPVVEWANGGNGLMDITPMLAAAQRERPFDDSDYIFEPMINGHRLLLTFRDGKPQLLTRHRNDVTRQYPELHNVPVREPVDIVLDGEVACLDPVTGSAQFQTLMERYRLKREPSIRDARKLCPVRYFVFDLLYYNGMDLRNAPLWLRKRLLDALLEDNAYFVKMRFADSEGTGLFEEIQRFGLEGMIGKRKASLYTAGKSDSWLQILTGA